MASPPRRDSLSSAGAHATTHAGLWLDRYLPSHDASGRVRDLHADLARVIRVPDGYQGAFERRRRALEESGRPGCVTRSWTATVQGRVVAGIGEANVREAGLTLLRAWGVPFLPGSSLKGIAAAASSMSADPAWAAEHGHRGDSAADLFGTHELSGLVHFHDAWWIPDGTRKLPIELDVMTVHHRQWYAALGSDKPGEGPQDWDEPVPVNFLTATGSYLIALTGPLEWVEVAGRILEHGLQALGVGAKTRSGYGRLSMEAIAPSVTAAPPSAAEGSAQEPSIAGPAEPDWISAQAWISPTGKTKGKVLARTSDGTTYRGPKPVNLMLAPELDQQLGAASEADPLAVEIFAEPGKDKFKQLRVPVAR